MNKRQAKKLIKDWAIMGIDNISTNFNKDIKELNQAFKVLLKNMLNDSNNKRVVLK